MLLSDIIIVIMLFAGTVARDDEHHLRKFAKRVFRESDQLPYNWRNVSIVSSYFYIDFCRALQL